MDAETPLILFGAFDRHNLGDLLLARLAAWRAAPRPWLAVGLRGGDQRPWGGFQVLPLNAVRATWSQDYGAAVMEIVHVGGEILDTDTWEAAVMLHSPDAARQRVADFDRDPTARLAWAQDWLGCPRLAPYLLGPGAVPVGSRRQFHALGGVGLGGRSAAFKDEVGAALAAVGDLAVRDRHTRAALAELGIAATLAPDPVAVAGVFLKELIATAAAPPGPYLAVQCAADFGDDANLDALAAILRREQLPVIIFRAGAAPWHDDLQVCVRLAARLPGRARICSSLHIAEICALIAGATACLASSLHALLVAAAFGVPRWGLEYRPGAGAKLRAYAETWGVFGVGAVQQIPPRWRSQQGL